MQKLYNRFSLGTVGNAEAVQPLITALGSQQCSICKAAATSLGQITKRLGDTTINARVVEQLIAALGAPSYLNQNEVSTAITKALITIGKPASEPLIAIFQDKSTYNYIRRYAAEALGAIRDPQATMPLTITLKDEDSYFREIAARSLGLLGDPSAVGPLCALLKIRNSDVQVEVGEHSIGMDVLGRGMGRLSYANPDFSNFNDEHHAIVEALGRIGDQSTIEILIDTIKDPRQFIRNEAAKALEKLGWKGKLPEAALIEECKDLIDKHTCSAGSIWSHMKSYSADRDFLIEELTAKYALTATEAEAIVDKATAQLYGSH